MVYDLHVHSTASDGVCSPQEIVLLAQQAGLKGLALTDHDTIDGIQEAMIESDKLGIEVITGIEINTDYQEREVHILGYGFDPTHEELLNTLETIKRARLERGRNMVEKLKQNGLPVDWGKVEEIAGGGVVGRPHIAMAMIEKGYIKSVPEAFTHFLGRGKPAYVPRYKITPNEAVQIIIGAGGCPVLAHPGLINNQTLALEIARLVQGIEVYYPEHSQKETCFWEDYCRKHLMAITGGSDFHGLPGSNSYIGQKTVDLDQVKILKEHYVSCQKK